MLLYIHGRVIGNDHGEGGPQNRNKSIKLGIKTRIYIFLNQNISNTLLRALNVISGDDTPHITLRYNIGVEEWRGFIENRKISSPSILSCLVEGPTSVK